jgi:hypothetical protein
VGRVHLWSSEAATGYPYSGLTTTSGALDAVKAYWNTNVDRQDEERTLVHMLSGKALGGGDAYLGVLCNWYSTRSSNSAYGMSAIPTDENFSWGGGDANPAAVVWDIYVVSLALRRVLQAPSVLQRANVFEKLKHATSTCFHSVQK